MYKYLLKTKYILVPDLSNGVIDPVLWFSSVQFSVMSDTLRPHESQHARPPCPSPTPGVHSKYKSTLKLFIDLSVSVSFLFSLPLSSRVKTREKRLSGVIFTEENDRDHYGWRGREYSCP